MRTKFAILASLLLASACSSPPPPQPATPVVQPKPQPVPILPADTPDFAKWQDWPIAPGDWVYRQDDRGSIALFGPVGQDAIVTLRCDKSRQRVYLSRQGSFTGSRAITMRSSSAMHSWQGAPTGGTPSYIAAEIVPTDKGLEDMAYTRGRIALDVMGFSAIAIPIWPEVSRVIEDCKG